VNIFLENGEKMLGRRNTIVIVEDNSDFVDDLLLVLEPEYEVFHLDKCDSLLPFLGNTPADLILLDYDLQQKCNGFDLLKSVNRHYPAIPVIMLTKYENTKYVVYAMKNGAHAYIVKNFYKKELLDSIQQAIASSSLHMSSEEYGIHDSRLLELIKVAAQSDLNILITGETGTGKSFLARQIFQASKNYNRTFRQLNIAAMDPQLLNSELYGYAKGAFTGADRDKPGLFELADKGTLFLDEIGEMNPAAQVNLLHTLESKQIRPVGGDKEINLDFHLIAASNRNLLEMVKEGKFPEDLYFRLNHLHIELPPLRKRPGEIIPLAKMFIRKFRKPGSSEIVLSPAAEKALIAESWPGNIRELETRIRVAMTLLKGNILDVEHLNWQGNNKLSKPSINVDDYLHFKFEEAKKRLLRKLKQEYIHHYQNLGLNVTETASRVGISREVLHRWKRQLEK